VPTLGVFAVIFDEAGRLLCVRLNYASKRWTTPGGRVETGESPLEALKREVLEETGLSITRASFSASTRSLRKTIWYFRSALL
jgi:8-oxo-dGTP pyrophosphatase MutT (NUDIX family)